MKAIRSKPVLLASLLAFSVQPLALRAQGSLAPPGPPGATMLTLSQVEPRTPISAVPFTITQAGSYYLTTNLTTTASNAITIAVSGVSLDLNGFTINSTVANAANGGAAILLGSGLQNITIVNGCIQSGVTVNGNGVFSGSGFGYGIYNSGAAPNVLASRVTVSGCLYDGIYLATGNASVVENCTVNTVGNYGIEADSVANSAALVCGDFAIIAITAQNSSAYSVASDGFHILGTAENCFGATGATSTYTGVYARYSVLNCVGTSTGGYGIFTDQAENSYGSGGSGDGVYAYGSAENCYGSSSSGDGIYAGATALNCSGSSSSAFGVYAYATQICYGVSGSGNGVYAYIANGCYGDSASSTGVNATTAQNCYGYSGSGNGVLANTAENCYGSSNGSNVGVYASSIANGCYGYSYSGTGVDAYIASVCYGTTSIGTALSATHNVNSF